MQTHTFEDLSKRIGFIPALRVCEGRLGDAFFDGLSYAQCLEALGPSNSSTGLRASIQWAAAGKAANAAECRALLATKPGQSSKEVILTRLLEVATSATECRPAILDEWPYSHRDRGVTRAIELCANARDAIDLYLACARADNVPRRVTENVLSYAATIGDCRALYGTGDNRLTRALAEKALRMARSTESCLDVANVPFEDADFRTTAYRRGRELVRTTGDCLMLVDYVDSWKEMNDLFGKALSLAASVSDAVEILADASQLESSYQETVEKRAVRLALRLAASTADRVSVLAMCGSGDHELHAYRPDVLAAALRKAKTIDDWKLVWDELTRNPLTTSAAECEAALAAAQRFVADGVAADIPKADAG